MKAQQQSELKVFSPLATRAKKETQIEIVPECLISWDDKKLCRNRNLSI